MSHSTLTGPEGGTSQHARDDEVDMPPSLLPLPQLRGEGSGTLALGSYHMLFEETQAFLSCIFLLDTHSLGKRPGSYQPLASRLARPLGCETSAWYPSSTKLSNHWAAQFLKEHGGHDHRGSNSKTDATD